MRTLRSAGPLVST